MRRLALVLPAFVLAGAACSSGGEPDVPPSPPLPAAVPTPRVAPSELGRLASRESLLGAPVVASADGPWTLRRVGAGDRDGAEAMDRGPSSGLADDKDAAGGKPGAIGIGGGGGAFPPRAFGARKTAAGGAPAPRPAETPALEPPAAPPAVPPTGASKDARLELREATARAESGAGESAAPEAVRTLRAGSTDDNADFDAYLEFLSTWADRKEIQTLWQPTDVHERRVVRVVDAAGRPVPGAVVSVVDEVADRVVWSGTTYGDGRAPWYPHLDPAGAASANPPTWLVEAWVRDGASGPAGARVEWGGEGAELTVTLDTSVRLPDPLRLDVAFVIDTTGSMGDEIASIKASLLRVTEQLRGLGREFDLRYGCVLYRDVGDDYVTATHAFTSDIEAFDQALTAVGAAGGGDGPESLNQALAEAVGGLDWREGAAKVAFLVADAPPHMDYAGDVPYADSARAALARGIRIHSVAASGLDPVGTLVFRQVAQLARGKFVFIEYGSTAASAESHGVTGAVRSDNLEDILFQQIRDELASWGR